MRKQLDGGETFFRIVCRSCGWEVTEILLARDFGDDKYEGEFPVYDKHLGGWRADMEDHAWHTHGIETPLMRYERRSNSL
jgi:hypothetical protein